MIPVLTVEQNLSTVEAVSIAVSQFLAFPSNGANKQSYGTVSQKDALLSEKRSCLAQGDGSGTWRS